MLGLIVNIVILILATAIISIFPGIIFIIPYSIYKWRSFIIMFIPVMKKSGKRGLKTIY